MSYYFEAGNLKLSKKISKSIFRWEFECELIQDSANYIKDTLIIPMIVMMQEFQHQRKELFHIINTLQDGKGRLANQH